MNKSYLDALQKRKDELLKELSSIENILKLYQDEEFVKKEKTSLTDNTKKVEEKSNASSKTVKEKIYNIISDLGGKAYVSQLVVELKKLYPDKNNTTINNTARNYIYLLKKDGRIKGELKENNKWLYHIT